MSKGHIGYTDYVFWTCLMIIGSVTCILHAKQQDLWTWKGQTPTEAQSLYAKVVVSIMAAIMGSIFAGLMTKACISTCLFIYRKSSATFAQMVLSISGYSPSRIVLLSHKEWLELMFLLLVLLIGTLTKQLAPISMNVYESYQTKQWDGYTSNYSTCRSIQGASTFIQIQSVLGARILSSMITPNTTYTDEYYDNSIPSSSIQQAETQFQRVLSYGNATCYFGNDSLIEAAQFRPTISVQDAWNINITLAMMDNGARVNWVNCTLTAGYADAETKCSNQTCSTERVTQIQKYTDSGNALNVIISTLVGMLETGSSGRIHPLQAWLLGGEITTPETNGDKITNQSVDMIQSRLQLLGTIASRVVCDSQNMASTHIINNYTAIDHYVYGISWTWPFWTIALIMVILWALIIVFIYLAPESRVLSVEWLLGQYLSIYDTSNLSGRSLSKVHENIRLNVVDAKPDDLVGSIAIIETDTQSKSKIIQGKPYGVY